ncbi:MAG: DUF4861 domain-containing protein [Cyclobacteriaceae bacterium]|nr:DUF4861 domain-containing protein [Cyclobacteriaceae bacterium]
MSIFLTAASGLLEGALAVPNQLYAQAVAKILPRSFQVEVTNPLSVARTEILVVIPASTIKADVPEFNPRAYVVQDGKTELASQYNQHDTDKPGIVVVLPKLAAKEKKMLTVRYATSGTAERFYPKRTQAELSHKVGGEFVNREYQAGEFKNVEYLRVPKEHKDHSWFIRYEGPGWESDLVGYRLYLDQRNATDVFGKTTHEMILQHVGLDGFDSYHHLQPWGMDVMKVGKSIGVGSIGSIINGVTERVEITDSVDCRITENGPVYSSFVTRYYGWKIGSRKHDVQSRISIHAGSRLTQTRLSITNQIDHIATGIVKDKAAPLIINKGDNSKWAYLATYGKQSLNTPPDELGLAVVFNPATVIEYTEDALSHLVKLKPTEAGEVTYYFLAAWVYEKEGIKTEAEFIQYLDHVALELANPVTVTLKTKK